MPERFEIYIVYKRRYINTLPFLPFTAKFNFVLKTTVIILMTVITVLSHGTAIVRVDQFYLIEHPRTVML